ncbi:MAG TPA: XdhC family protein [Alphaproteobacteria bacterium]|nr:XdhC family protein [Alphaproteobacteria bacterium]
MKRAILDALLEARGKKLPAALATDLKSGSQALVTLSAVTGGLDLNRAELANVRSAIRDDRSQTFDANARRIFAQVFNPPLRMVVVGAVHIAQSLAPIASLAGYAVMVVDPRRAFATGERFPNVEITHDWPDDALMRLVPDRRTAVVTLTHDPKIDDPALEAALRSDAFYIGALGSTRTHAKRLARLKESGFDDADLGRIHGPAGLSIGAKSPAEIAIAIMAQVTGVLHAKELAAKSSVKELGRA